MPNGPPFTRRNPRSADGVCNHRKARDSHKRHELGAQAQRTSGGGGNRTRVPRYFSDGFYVRRRMISAVRSVVPNRRGSFQASQELFLVAGIPSSDLRRFGIGNWLLGLSDKNPQPGTPV